MFAAYLDRKAQVDIRTGSQAVAGTALRGETDIMSDELAPLHQHARVDVIVCRFGAPHYIPADLCDLRTFNNTPTGSWSLENPAALPPPPVSM